MAVNFSCLSQVVNAKKTSSHRQALHSPPVIPPVYYCGNVNNKAVSCYLRSGLKYIIFLCFNKIIIAIILMMNNNNYSFDEYSNTWKLFEKYYDKFLLITENEGVKAGFRQVYNIVKNKYLTETNNPRHRYNYDKIKIQLCREKFDEIMDLFSNKTKYQDQSKESFDRNEFIKAYPVWENSRQETIKSLAKIIKTLKDNKETFNAINIMSSVVGIGGSLAIVGSTLFPPAGIAAWILSSGLAIGGGVATVASGGVQVVSAVAENELLHQHMEVAKRVIDKDLKNCHILEEWFKPTKHTEALNKAINEILDFNILQCMHDDIINFCCTIKNVSETLKTAKIFDELIVKILGEFHPTLKVVILGVLLLALIYIGNRALLSSFYAAAKIVTASKVFCIGMNGARIPKAIATRGSTIGAKKALGKLAGLGIVLDSVNIFLATKDIMNGSVSEHSEKLIKASDELKKEMEMLKDIYKEQRKEYYNDTVHNFEKLKLIFHEIKMRYDKHKNLFSSIQIREQQNVKLQKDISDFIRELTKITANAQNAPIQHFYRNEFQLIMKNTNFYIPSKNMELFEMKEELQNFIVENVLWVS